MALKIGELVGYLRLENQDWVNKHRQARKDLDDLQSDWNKAGSKADAAAKSFVGAVASVAKIAPAVAALSGAGATISTMAGAVGLIPAAGVGALLAINTLKVGVQGFGDALKDSADPKAFAEDLKQLAPEAQQTAIAFRDLRGAWSELQKNVQNELFKGLAPEVRKLGETYIPLLRKGMSGIASDFNLAAKQTGQWLAKGEQVKTVNSIFDNTRSLTGELAHAMQPIVSIMLDIIAVGTEFFPNISGGFGDAAQRAAEFVHNARESGQLHDWISGGLSALGDLWQLLRNIGSIVKTVFSAFQSSGAGLLPTLIKITDAMRTFLESAEGQEALHSLASVLGQVSSVASGVLMEALHQLAPVIIALAPGFGQLAQQVGGALVAALRAVGPILQAVAGFLSDNVGWLGPLAIGIYAAIKAFEAAIVVIKLFNLVCSLNPYVIIIAATIALVALIIMYWDQIVGALKAAWNWIMDGAKWAFDHVKSAVIEPIDKALKWIGTAWDGMVDWFKQLPGRIGDAVKAVFNFLTAPFRAAWEYISGLVNAIMEAFDQIDGRLGTPQLKGAAKFNNPNNPAAIAGNGGHAFRASGGPVVPGRSYIVGERGEELYRPNTPGMIVPNRDLGRGGPTVHIDNYYPPANASPYEVAADLDWMARSGGH